MSEYSRATDENEDFGLTDPSGFTPTKPANTKSTPLHEPRPDEARLQLATLLLGGLQLSGKACPKCNILPTVTRADEFFCAHCDEVEIRDVYLHLSSMHRSGYNVPLSVNMSSMLSGRDNMTKTINLTDNAEKPPSSKVASDTQDVFVTASCIDKSTTPMELTDADPKMLTQAMADASMLHNMLMGSTVWNPVQSLVNAPPMSGFASTSRAPPMGGFASTIQRPSNTSKGLLEKIDHLEQGLSTIADQFSTGLGKESLSDLNGLQNKLGVLNTLLEAIERIEKIKRGNEEPLYARQMAGIPMMSTVRMADSTSLPGSSVMKADDARCHPFSSTIKLDDVKAHPFYSMFH